MSTDPVTDNRESLTHSHIPEHLVAKGRDSGGNIQLGDVVVRQLVAVVGYGRRVSHGLLLGCG